ncbi:MULTISPECIES: VWA domain-containing protein [unclassified Marinobacterium]|uniref:vWA domain-containing protein n=2 Tax=unclassified Marinobacterium TaxID=2644139 RepID=UPI0015689E2C|nr:MULTISPECIES: VWA domain-containing protein [unclassified Marinobacterium]NRP11018.1 von Willebrand factor type A domain protein [Marinobacterium sp. xm-g-48]NRP48011.1 von Willebrand factor type A domain protein [Marinobacterium sp. xm-d-543]NRP83862.1 von Willebrand factor type A domain protein [Marinobacterium sp. xm-d-509]NRQ24250.1 von Willebrand factor type A domain protein [Marinobacterium sp. xm-m-312]
MFSDWGMLQPLWLLLTPLILILFWRRRDTDAPWPDLLQRERVRYPLYGELTNEQPEASQYQPRRERLLLMSMTLFVLALAQPVVYRDTIELPDQKDPVDLVLLVDTNITMVLKDYFDGQQSIERMSLTKELLSEFVNGFQGNRIGLSIMGNPPYHWLPFTDDRDAVTQAIARIRVTLGGRLSDMSASLKLVSDNYPTDLNPVVVMVTDSGMQLGETSPQAAAKALADAGYTLYVIAIGSTELSQEQKARAGFVYDPVDLALLDEVAKAGAGKMFHALNIDAFEEALQTISREQTTQNRSINTLPLVEPLYPWFILSGLTLLILIFVRRSV